MIDVDFAQKFIGQITKYTEYNINIMNEKGIIIASRDPERIGTFHSVAYHIVHSTEDLVITTAEDRYPGVLPGINQVIESGSSREGCVGITGDPEKVKPVALIIKMAVEAMLRFELQENQNRLRRSRKDHFFSLLTQVEFADQQEIRTLAKELQYSEQPVRIPVLCRLSGDAGNAEQLLRIIKSSPLHGSEDISSVIDETHILVFKTLPRQDLFYGYKKMVREYLEPPLQRYHAIDGDTCCTFFAGSLQSCFSLYYYGYRHCKWMENALETVHAASSGSGKEADLYFFYDYEHLFIEHILPQSELHRMFNVFDSKLDSRFKKSFCQVVESLIQSNYNLVAASVALGIHKNTLIYRLHKIRDELHVDPMESFQDRLFMESLYFQFNRSL